MSLDNPDDIFLGPEDEEPPNRPRKKAGRRAPRLQPLPGPYVRVPLQWLCKPCREHIFDSEARLFLYLLYRSCWGQRGVKVTDTVAAEIGLPEATKRRALRRLERTGWVRVERKGFTAPVVWPIVLTG